MGPESEIKTYRVFLPWPTEVAFEMTAPEARRFELRERSRRDETSALDQYPWVATRAWATSRPRSSTNYGLEEDYALLDPLGVSVEGRIVLARYRS